METDRELESSEVPAIDAGQYDEEGIDSSEDDFTDDETVILHRSSSSEEDFSLPSGRSHTLIINYLPWFSA